MYICFFVIIQAHQEQFAVKVLKCRRIVTVPDLSDGFIGGFIPFQFNDHCRQCRALFGNIHNIRISVLGWKFFDLAVLIDACDICVSDDCP